MVAIIGGEPRRFRPLIDLYRETGKQSLPHSKLMQATERIGAHVAPAVRVRETSGSTPAKS